MENEKETTYEKAYRKYIEENMNNSRNVIKEENRIAEKERDELFRKYIEENN